MLRARKLRVLPLAPVLAFLCLPALASAGDVAAKLKNGSLFITSGAATDDLTVQMIDAGTGLVRVTPGAGTTVNGAATPQDFAPVTKDVRVELGAGDDHVTVIGLFPHDIRLHGGDGYQAFEVKNASAARDIVIEDSGLWRDVNFDHVGAGRDLVIRVGEQGPLNGSIDLFNLNVQRKLSITTGTVRGTIFLFMSEIGGAATVRAAGGAQLDFEMCLLHAGLSTSFRGTTIQSLKRTTVAGATTLSARDGATGSFAIDTVTFDGPFKLKSSTLGGNTTMASATVNSDFAFDVRGPGIWNGVVTSCTFMNDVRGRGGRGIDGMTIAGSFLGGQTDMRLGAGDDVLALVNTTANDVRADLGAGNDLFSAGGTTSFSILRARTGSGSDSIGIGGLSVAGDAEVAAGSGANDIEIKTSAIGGALDVSAGKDHDVIDLTGTTATGGIHVHTGGGNDTELP